MKTFTFLIIFLAAYITVGTMEYNDLNTALQENTSPALSIPTQDEGLLQATSFAPDNQPAITTGSLQPTQEGWLGQYQGNSATYVALQGWNSGTANTQQTVGNYTE